MRTVYLAGPMVFRPDAPDLFRRLAEVCARFGLGAVSPLDGLAPDQPAAAIRAANLAKLKACDGVIACLTPFRGPGADAGTAWEMGYAEALGKPVVPWTEADGDYAARVPAQSSDGALWCAAHGMVVEDFGLADNLMLAAGPIPVQPGFEAAARTAAAVLAAG